jgi:hypothetical protein
VLPEKKEAQAGLLFLSSRFLINGVTGSYLPQATADFAAATEPAKLEQAKARYLGKRAAD